jgi:hypothetical protein
VLFEAAGTYAPGEPGTQGLPQPEGQNVWALGKYHLDRIKPANVWVGLIGLLVLAYLVHRYGGRRGKR